MRRHDRRPQETGQTPGRETKRTGPGRIWRYPDRLLEALPISVPAKEKVRLGGKKVSEIWRVFRGNRLGMSGLAILVFFAVMAVFPAQIMLLLSWVADAAGNPWAYPYGPFDMTGDGVMLPPSPEHWLGTDADEQDILARVVYGSRVSLEIGLVAAAASMGLGTIVGLVAGFWGGWRDEVLMRVTDVFLVLPWLALMIVLATTLPGGQSVTKVIFVISITGWSYTARIVRAQVLSLKERVFVERAKSVGSSELHVIRRHVFPNVFPLVFANGIITVALSILSESTLSYIALGPSPAKVVTWGNILYAASQRNAMGNDLYMWIIVPGLCIVFVVLAFTFIGYALDEIFNPKLRKR